MASGILRCGILQCGTLELEGEVQYLTKASVPIGFTYIQLPGKPEPTELYYGIWENVSNEYPGDFFRVEGGEAEIFDPTNLTEQLDQMQLIIGYATFSRSSIGASGAFHTSSSSNTRPNSGSLSTTNLHLDTSRSANARTSSTTEGETRSINRTIRIWERVEA